MRQIKNTFLFGEALFCAFVSTGLLAIVGLLRTLSIPFESLTQVFLDRGHEIMDHFAEELKK